MNYHKGIIMDKFYRQFVTQEQVDEWIKNNPGVEGEDIVRLIWEEAEKVAIPKVNKEPEIEEIKPKKPFWKFW